MILSASRITRSSRAFRFTLGDWAAGRTQNLHNIICVSECNFIRAAAIQFMSPQRRFSKRNVLGTIRRFAKTHFVAVKVIVEIWACRRLFTRVTERWGAFVWAEKADGSVTKFSGAGHYNNRTRLQEPRLKPWSDNLKPIRDRPIRGYSTGPKQIYLINSRVRWGNDRPNFVLQYRYMIYYNIYIYLCIIIGCCNTTRNSHEGNNNNNNNTASIIIKGGRLTTYTYNTINLYSYTFAHCVYSNWMLISATRIIGHYCRSSFRCRN